MARPRLSPKQKKTLKDLEDLARQKGLVVSYGDLRYGGVRLKAGHCLYEGRTWVIMDRRQPFEEQVDVFREALAEHGVPEEELPSEAAPRKRSGSDRPEKNGAARAGVQEKAG